MSPIVLIAAIPAILIVFIWLGLQVKPLPFPNNRERTPNLTTIPLPEGLPAPVERYYRKLYGDRIPVIDSAVAKGRAVIRPVMDIPLPTRFVFIHKAGQAYRHYFESTLFGIPFLRVNEGIAEGKSFFESPMGTYRNDPNTNQGANLALWAEAGWFPTIWVTDPRVRWQGVDEHTALLFVPYGDKTEHFVIRFDPDTDMITHMEAMRFRNPGDTDKILWFANTVPSAKTLPGTKISAEGSAMWLDQGKPWAHFTIEDMVYNVNVDDYVRGRGR